MLVRPIFETHQAINQTEYYWFKNSFSEEELDWVDNLKNLYPSENAETIGGDGDEIRKSSIKWINFDDNSAWLYEKLSNQALEANSVIWNFNLNSIIDSIQYTEYPENGGHYDWHMDIGPCPINHRKISVVTLLSDPSEFEGGDLELWTGGAFKTAPKIKGCTILFPSFLLHRVTPVTKGVRRSLVLWLGGDNYR